MAIHKAWLTKLKSQISHKLTTPKSESKSRSKSKSKSPQVGVLAFEIAALLSKLLALHHSLSDSAVIHRLKTTLSNSAAGKLISCDHSFLLSLAAAEIIDTLRLTSDDVTRLASRCSDEALRAFPASLRHFADDGVDSNAWEAAAGRDLDAIIRRADRLVSATSALYREMEELTLLENSLRKKKNASPGIDQVNTNDLEIQHKIAWQKHEVKYVREKSLWNRTFDSVVLLSARLIFTILARIKIVFAIESESSGQSFFHTQTAILTPAKNTLGSSSLALHYSNLIIIIEKMIKSPHLVGLDAREEVYSMLPSSIRSALRSRLKGVGFTATDPGLAGEWRDALSRILAWVTPLAHNMIKWQSERSFEHNNLMPKTNNVLLAQTMFYANKEKTEATISELLVGFNYIWRFEREMNCKAFLKCSNFFSNNNKN